jgi:hypothetical protein
MNKFIINEEEKRRILMMHQSATKKQYLNESTGVFDSLIGKTVYFTPVGIASVFDFKTNERWGSDILNIEALMDDKSHERLGWLSENELYGKITNVQVLAGLMEDIVVTFTTNIPELNQRIGGTKEIQMDFECGSDKFEYRRDMTSSTNADLGSVWLENKMVTVSYTCDKLAEILNSNMPCSKDAFDLSLNQENIPNTLA